MELKEANKVMGIVNNYADEIRKKKEEFDTKRMHDKEAHLIYQGLRFAYIEVCKLQADMDELLTNE